jgi:uncharacterized alpha-E superfamily protein
LLDDVSSALAAITGAQSDRMTRDDGWQLLSIGRQLERLGFFAESLHLAVQTGAFDAGADDAAQASAHYSALLSLFDSSITFRAQHQQSRELEPLVSLLVLDEENPRALARVAHALRSRLAKLAKTPMGSPDPIGRLVPDPASWDLLALCSRDGNDRLTTLSKQLESCAATAWQLSDAVSSLYFRHTLRAGMLGV